MTYQQIREGKALINTDIHDIVSRKQDVFYNPEMEFERDITVHFLDSLNRTDLDIALPLAGTGVRALRLLLETQPSVINHIHANDMKEQAFTLMKQNKELNLIGDDRLSLYNLDGRVFLNKERGYDIIDIDPFGSPNIVLYEALHRIRNNGYLIVKATDTAALAGTYPRACKQKYSSVARPIPQRHEMGLRILARKVQLMAMHFAKSARPVISYHHKHYYKIFFKVEKGKKKAADMLDNIETYFLYCTKCGLHECTSKKVCPHCFSSEEVWCVGPIFDGPLEDSLHLQALQEHMTSKQELDLASRLLIQSSVPVVGHYDMHEIAKRKKKELNTKQHVCETLQKEGFLAGDCAFNSQGIITNAPATRVKELITRD